MNKDTLIESLYSFIRRRPGLEFGNYGNVSAYQAEMRAITRDRHDAAALLSAVACHDSITYDDMLASLSAFSGRLSWDGKALSYCAGQYFPTEYRKAVSACMAQALRRWYREHCDCATWDDVRNAARREFSRSIASRWFN